MKKSKSTRYRLEVRKSPIEGQGLFAAEDIPWGKKIKEYQGTVISDKEAKKRTAKDASAIMELGDGKNIDGFDKGNGAALVNHSAEDLANDKGPLSWALGILRHLSPLPTLRRKTLSDYRL